MLRLPGPHLSHTKPRLRLWVIQKQDADRNGLYFAGHTAGSRVHWVPAEDIQDRRTGFSGPWDDCCPCEYQFWTARRATVGGETEGW